MVMSGWAVRRNPGGGQFEDLSQRVGPALAENGAWRGVAVADIDEGRGYAVIDGAT